MASHTLPCSLKPSKRRPSHNTCQRMSKNAPKWTPKGPQRAPEWYQNGLWKSQGGPRRLPNEALEGPKWTLMTPNGLWNSPGWPRGAQKVAKAAPKRSQMAQLGVRRRLGGAQVAPREPMREPRCTQDDPGTTPRRAKRAQMAQDGVQRGRKN